MNSKKKKTLLLAIPLLALALLIKVASGEGRLLYVSREDDQAMSARFLLFDGEKERKIGLHRGDSLEIEYREIEKSGNLELLVFDPSDHLLQRIPGDAGYTITAGEKGNYLMKVAGDSARGAFSLRWRYIPISEK